MPSTENIMDILFSLGQLNSFQYFLVEMLANKKGRIFNRRVFSRFQRGGLSEEESARSQKAINLLKHRCLHHKGYNKTHSFTKPISLSQSCSVKL